MSVHGLTVRECSRSRLLTALIFYVLATHTFAQAVQSEVAGTVRDIQADNDHLPSSRDRSNHDDVHREDRPSSKHLDPNSPLPTLNHPAVAGMLGDCSTRHTLHNRTHLHSLADVNELLCHLYKPWSKWRRCNPKCLQMRVRRCHVPDRCGKTVLKQKRQCGSRRECGSQGGQRKAGGLPRSTLKVIRSVVGDNVYGAWSSWGRCTRSCRQRRWRECLVREVCRGAVLTDSRPCGSPGTRCHTVINEHLTTNTPPRPSTEYKEEVDVPESESDSPKAEEADTHSIGETSHPLNVVRDTCGQKPAQSRGSYRVVGGQETQRLAWPWQTAFVTKWNEQYCGGTLIAPQWILTAAHCVRKSGRRRRFVIKVGEHDLQEYEDTEDKVKPEVEFPHPEYDYHTIMNDIALVRLKTPVAKRSGARYACLSNPSFSPDPRSLCYVLGWGKQRNTHLFGAEKLHEVQVPLVSHQRCQRAFDFDVDNSTQLCAGYRRGGKDACAGDSGGPLLCPKGSGRATRWVLTGVTSFGEGCGRKGKYGIYTRVASYLQWITDTIQAYENSS